MVKIDTDQVEVNEEGYLLIVSDWSKEIAIEMAKEGGIDLTNKYFEVLDYLRKEQAVGTALSIRKVGKSGIVDVKGVRVIHRRSAEILFQICRNAQTS